MDEAVQRYPQLEHFLQQGMNENASIEASRQVLAETLGVRQ
nr:hypothetical protein [Halomonas sp.]